MSEPFDTCPKCGSEFLEADGIQFDSGECNRIIQCSDCNFSYGESFTFNQNFDLESGNELDEFGEEI